MSIHTPHLMVDLENLDSDRTRPGAILELGAVWFDWTGQILDRLHIPLALLPQIGSGRTVCPDTQAWWARRPDFEDVIRGDIPLDDGLHGLAEFWHEYREEDSSLHAWGASYDPVILEAAYRRELGWADAPWPYYAVRCSRSLCRHHGISREGPTAHRAVEDCERQIRALIQCPIPISECVAKR